METLTKTRTIGPLLTQAIAAVEQNIGSERMMEVAAEYNGEPVGVDQVLLPIVVKLSSEAPRKGERWDSYKSRIIERLEPLRNMLRYVIGQESDLLITANAVKTQATPNQIRLLSERDDLEIMELDPIKKITAMDESIQDVELPTFQQQHPTVDGTGVRVAVLDSGIDIQHPYLNVAASVSTCGETVDIPGRHGTHCAGSIASQDALVPGIAPGVTLLNIKVMNAAGQGAPSSIQKGIDAALDLDAEVISLSLGYNHLPRGAQSGHGWSCPPETCALCTAVNNASAIEGVVVVVAAGNEHATAEYLRQFGYGDQFDTELRCPGQATEAITVGALTKSDFLPASFSSRGPTSYGATKPDISAPGVNILSTAPAPRNAAGELLPNPKRTDLFFTDSGTSMATPIVSGAVALIIQLMKENNQTVTPQAVKDVLYANGIANITDFGPNDVGRGRLSLRNL